MAGKAKVKGALKAELEAAKVSAGNGLLKSELLGAGGAPGPELSFCAGVALVGGYGTLTEIKGVVGL